MDCKAHLILIVRTFNESHPCILPQVVCSLIIWSMTFSLYAQRLGIGTDAPDHSSIVDMTSTNKGLLMPRMTSAQRLQINMPAVGLMVFDNTTASFWYYNTQGWTELNQWIQIGNSIHSNASNVGIGIVNPLHQLEVIGTIRSKRPGSTSDGSYISFSSPTGDPGIIIARGDGSGGVQRRWDLKIDNVHSFRLEDNTAGKLRMLIDDSGRVGIGESVPDESAALDINSTTKGFLPPRMTRVQRNAIVSPAEGLIIRCSDCGMDGELQVFNGQFWTNIIGGNPEDFQVGDLYQGGIVAYIFQPGDPGYELGHVHGIIAAPEDLSPAEWGCINLSIPGAQGIVLGTGNANTIAIVNDCATFNTAAKLCYNLVLDGYNDWRLPSKNELHKLFDNRVAIGGFGTGYYWSSSEYTPEYAYIVTFDTGAWGAPDKSLMYHVRPIRYF